MRLPCCPHAFCHVLAVFCNAFAMLLPCVCNVLLLFVVMRLPCVCHAFAMCCNTFCPAFARAPVPPLIIKRHRPLGHTRAWRRSTRHFARATGEKAARVTGSPARVTRVLMHCPDSRLQSFVVPSEERRGHLQASCPTPVVISTSPFGEKTTPPSSSAPRGFRILRHSPVVVLRQMRMGIARGVGLGEGRGVGAGAVLQSGQATPASEQGGHCGHSSLDSSPPSLLETPLMQAVRTDVHQVCTIHACVRG